MARGTYFQVSMLIFQYTKTWQWTASHSPELQLQIVLLTALLQYDIVVKGWEPAQT